MGAIVDLLKSERGLFALALTIASTVLTALGHMTIDTWKEFNLYIFGIYVVGKTATGVTGMITSSRGASTAPTEPAEPAEPAEPVTPVASGSAASPESPKL